MSERKKWSDIKHKCTPEQLAKARAELEDEMRAYEATPTQGGASSEGNDEEPDFRQLRDAARRGRRCANCLYPDACARTDTCRAAVQRLKVARGGIPAPESVLSEAARLVDGDRQQAYGHPRDNHATTAELWGAYLRRRFTEREDWDLGLPLDAFDVCMLNILQKVSRLAHTRQRDGLVDIAGFARNAEMVGDDL